MAALMRVEFYSTVAWLTPLVAALSVVASVRIFYMGLAKYESVGN